jgi:hypothetical protein
MGAFYWERHPEGPFVTLIAVAAANCSPDAFDGAYPDLISRARAPDADDEEIREFAAGLRQALADPGQLPGDELSEAVEYTTAATRRSCAACGMKVRRPALHPAVTGRNKQLGPGPPAVGTPCQLGIDHARQGVQGLVGARDSAAAQRPP